MTALAWGLSLLGLVMIALYVFVRHRTREDSWRLFEALLAWQTLYFIGAASQLVLSPGDATGRFVSMVATAYLALTTTAIILRSSVRLAPAAPPPLEGRESALVWSAAGIAALVCLVFIVAILRNEQLLLILAGVVTGDAQFLDFRTTMYSGAAVYLAPGYVKQFRDVLLPAGLIAVIGFQLRPFWPGVVALALLGFGAALLSGERFALMIYVLTIGVAFAIRPSTRAIALRAGVPVFALALFGAFVGFTVLLGRAEQDASFFSLIADAGIALFDRLVLTLPRENAGGFAVWSPLAPSWGANWTSAIAGILPGSQTGLDQELHEVLGGSALGTSPLGLAPDAFLAWGILGLAIWPPLFCLLLDGADRLLVRAGRASGQALRVALVPLSFGWYSPFLFILNGGVVLIAVAVALRVLDRHGRAHAQ